MSYARKLDLPAIPTELLADSEKWEEYTPAPGLPNTKRYKVSEALKDWLTANIADGKELNWLYNVTDSEPGQPSQAKQETYRYAFYIDLGGENTALEYLDESNQVIESHQFSAQEWAMLRTDIRNWVVGMTAGQQRKVITAILNRPT